MQALDIKTVALGINITKKPCFLLILFLSESGPRNKTLLYQKRTAKQVGC
jgi:hypothetical protein